MIGEIINGLMQESKSLLIADCGTVMLKTDFKAKDIGSYAMPLVLVDLMDADQSGQCIGGMTKMEYVIGLSCYNIMVDVLGDDLLGVSANLLNNPIDTFRQHFTREQYNTDEMNTLLNDFGFRFTLSGVQPAEALFEDGEKMGFKIVFDSVAFDTTTLNDQPSPNPIQSIKQINNPPFN